MIDDNYNRRVTRRTPKNAAQTLKNCVAYNVWHLQTKYTTVSATQPRKITLNKWYKPPFYLKGHRNSSYPKIHMNYNLNYKSSQDTRKCFLLGCSYSSIMSNCHKILIVSLRVKTWFSRPFIQYDITDDMISDCCVQTLFQGNKCLEANNTGVRIWDRYSVSKVESSLINKED